MKFKFAVLILILVLLIQHSLSFAAPIRRGPRVPRVPRGGAQTRLSMTPLWQSQASIVGVNALGYLLSLTTSSHYHVDLLGTAAFAFGALPSLHSSSIARVRLSALCVILWSFRLGSFLFYRVLKTGHDGRLDDILNHPIYSLGFWTYSALWGVLCSLPHSLGAASRIVAPRSWVLAGTVIFGIGFLIESLADYQKWSFKQSGAEGFCNVGLWKISQHPNWFGNLVLWLGILVMSAPALVDPTTTPTSSILWRSRRLLVALLGPAFMWWLFDSQATGRLLSDSLEATRAKYGYGQDSEYTRYIDTTPLIIPSLWKS